MLANIAKYIPALIFRGQSTIETTKTMQFMKFGGVSLKDFVFPHKIITCSQQKVSNLTITQNFIKMLRHSACFYLSGYLAYKL